MARKVSRATRSANGRLAHDERHRRWLHRRRDAPALVPAERVDDDRQDVAAAAPQPQRFLQPATRRTATAMRYPAARTNHKLAPDAIGVEQFCVQPCARERTISRLHAVVRYRSRRNLDTVQRRRVEVESFIYGAENGKCSKMRGIPHSQAERFAFISRAMRTMRRLRRGDEAAKDHRAADAERALLEQPLSNQRDDVLLTGYDRDETMKPSYPYEISSPTGMLKTLTEGEFTRDCFYAANNEKPSNWSLAEFWKFLKHECGVSMSGVDLSKIKWVCIELCCGYGNMSLAMAERFEDVVVIAIDLNEKLLSRRAAAHKRVKFLQVDILRAMQVTRLKTLLAGRLLHVHSSPTCKNYSKSKRPYRARLLDEGRADVVAMEYLEADIFVQTNMDIIRTLDPVTASVENPNNDTDGLGSRRDLLVDVYGALAWLAKWTLSYCHFNKGLVRKDTDFYVTRNLQRAFEAIDMPTKCIPGSSSACAYTRRSGARAHKTQTEKLSSAALKARIPLACARKVVDGIAYVRKTCKL